MEEPENMAEALFNFFNTQLARASASSLYEGPDVHDEVGEQVIPSDEQRALKPGDLVVVGIVSNLKEDLMVGEVLDPREHAEDFPDWEHRVNVQGFILINYYVEHTPEGGVGWVRRAKCIPADRELWDKMHEVATGQVSYQGELPPAWLVEMYANSVLQLGKANPESGAPKPFPCPECNRLTVLMRTRIERTTWFGVGHDSETDSVIEAFTPYKKQTHKVFDFICLSCGKEAEIDPDATIRIPRHLLS